MGSLVVVDIAESLELQVACSKLADTTMKLTTNPDQHRRLQALTALVMAASLLTGCGTDARRDQKAGSAAAVVESKDDGLNGTLVDDPPLRVADVSLHDTRGILYRLGTRPPKKATALFFGFTHCEDVCPTTTADLATARRLLPQALAKRVNIVFVTVDPRRDTASVLRTWLDQFDTDIIGLRGPTSVVNEAESSLYADRSTVDPKSGGHHGTQPDGHEHEHKSAAASPGDGAYEVSHSGSVYVFGPHGETVLYSGGTTADQYATDFTRLLKGS